VLVVDLTISAQTEIPKLQIRNENIEIIDTISMLKEWKKNQYISDMDKQKITIKTNQTEMQIMIEISNYENESNGMILVSNKEGIVYNQNTQVRTSNLLDLKDLMKGEYILTVIINKTRKDWIIKR
jgi:hypothetical protein